ncbi:DNA ligase D [Myxococcus qinghaiensis]|uniref:DNA ligase D n=1 Tax=Myxococcus qinghaiensis TaxID=2906758 RepID=UPI0020A7D904|nr:DNA ligase D [Myxococcus qinghaiensis]MCP3164908.1 DNA ligase D [Myxococcus qinghaiensis]
MNRSNARLRAYRRKRDFRRTPEPAPEAPARPEDGAPRFVVHKHDATSLHYDLRLEVDGGLASWAVPKGPSYDPGAKRLAVETEDHPLAYADFEGHIPDDAYGGGDSLLWDRGTYDTVPPGQASAQREHGRLHVELHGEKLQGEWHLIRTRLRGSAKKPQWLLFKAKDETADASRDITTERPESVKSGQVETQGPVRRRGGGKQRKAVARKRSAGRPGRAAAVPRTPKKLLERMGSPMLARLAQTEEAGDDTHVYEVKYDGFRALAALVGGKLALQSRRGNDLSKRFPDLAKALHDLRVKDVVLDGELVALDDKGRSRFQLLQQGLEGVEQRFVVFDVPWLNGEDLRGLPLEERRARLERLMRDVELPLQISERMKPPLKRALAAARRHGWEGLIAKRRGSPYVDTRSGDWLKLKVISGQEVVILGYLPIQNERSKTELGALLVGVHGEDGFHDVGKVGTGFTAKDRRELRALLDKDVVRAPVAVDAKPRKGAVWVKPRHVAQVHFSEWTEDGRLRQPVYQGLRIDKAPTEVVRERPAPSRSKASRTTPRRTTQRAASSRSTRASTRRATGALRAPRAQVARTSAPARREEPESGLAKLTHGDRVLFPRAGLTKADVFAYYREVAPLLVPILKDRPISVQQWPAGIAAPGFFRHELSGTPSWVPTLRVRHVEKSLRHVNVNGEEPLLWLANQSALTLHMWLSHAPKLSQPDFLAMDLDPGKGGWSDVVTVALALRELLEEQGLESYPKTSGKRGLHVLIPLAPGHTYAKVQAHANALAQALEERLGDLATTVRGIEARKGRLYLDAGQNARGKTVVAPYSLRAREGAPFSAPLKWSEVTRRLDPARINLRTLKKRLDAVGDLFAPAMKNPQRLPD